MKWHWSNTARGIAVFPFDGFRSLVVLADIAHDFLVKILGRSKDAARNHIALDAGEPVLNLPGDQVCAEARYAAPYSSRSGTC